MKKTTFRLITAVLLVLFVFTSIPMLENSFPEMFSAFAAEDSDFTWSTNADGTLNLVKYSGTDASVTIPASVNGKRVTTIGTDAFKDNSTMNYVKMTSISYVAYHAFNNCPNFYNLEYIADENYNGCSVASSAFYNCNLLIMSKCYGKEYYMDWLTKKLGITDQTSDYTKVYLVFNYLTSNFGYAFSAMNSSRRLPLYDGFIGAVMGIDSMVCAGFASSMSNILNYLGVECISPQGYCTGTPHAWNMVNVDGRWYHLDASGAGYLRWYPFLVSDSTISKYNTSYSDFTPDADYSYDSAPSLYKSGDLWYSKNSDGTITIEHCRMNSTIKEVPKTINGYTVSKIGKYAFFGFDGYTIDLPNTITSIGEGAFHSADTGKLTIPDSVTSLGENLFAWSDIKEVTLSKGLTSIEPDVFRNCCYLSKVVVPSNIKVIKQSAFRFAYPIELVLCGADTEISPYAFVGMYSNTPTVKIYHTPNAKCLQYTQSDAEIEFIPLENKMLTFKIGSYEYEINDSTSTISVSLPYSDNIVYPEGVTYTASEYASVTLPKKISLPNSFTVTVTSLDGRKKVYTVKTSVAQSMEPIKGDGFEIKGKFVLYPTAKALAEDYYRYFPSVASRPESGGSGGADWARYNDKISTVSFPKNVTEIGDYALAGLNKVSSLTIPSTVTSIGAGAVEHTAFYNNADNWVNNVLYSGNYALAVSSAANGKTLAFKTGTKVIADNNNDRYGGSYAAESPVKITIPASVTNVGKDFAFAYSQLESISVNTNNTVYSSRDGILYDKSGKTMIKYPENKSLFAIIPDGTVTLGEKSLHGYNFGILYLPDSVKTISDNVFGDYYNSTDISLVLFEGTEAQWNKITGISQFSNIRVLFNQKGDVSQIKNVVATSGSAQSCITEDNKLYCFGSGELSYYISSHFGSYTVEELHIMEGVTTCSSYTFSNMLGSLKKLYLPSTLTSVNWWSFTTLNLLSYVSVENTNFEMVENSFSGCQLNIEVHFGKNVNQINRMLFNSLGTVSKISVDKNNPNYCAVDGVLYSKDKKTLHYYPAKKTNTSFVVPDTVETIAYEAFSPGKLTKITIPTSVKTIGENAFSSANALKTIVYKGSACNWKKVKMSDTDRTAISKKMSFAIAATDAAAGHTWKAATCTKAKTCKTCGVTSGSKLGHKYTNACDKTCDRCLATRTITHTYKTTTVTKATLTANGKTKTSCTVCGYVKSTATISYPKTFTLSATSYTYNGKVKTPTVTVKDAAGKVLTKGTDYTVAYASGRTAPGTYKVTVTMKGKYTGTKTLTFKINPISISTCDIKLSSTSLTYNGKVKTPTVTVTNSYGTKLTKDKHYTVTYSEGRTNAGTYKVTVKMIGNYTGTKTLSFKINPINISTCNVKLSATSLTYNGSVRTPSVTVTNSSGTKLTKDKHYTVTYASGRTNAGTYKLTVKMKGNYTGTKTLSFKINPISISTCTVKLSATSFTYDGKVKAPTVTVTNSYGTKLTKDKHYTVTYASGRKSVGTYKVTIKMIGNYTGTKTLTFKINPPATSVASLTAGTKSVTVNLNKKTTQTTGYQIQYSTSKDFTNAKTVTLAKNTTVKTTLTGLNSAKTYYVRVRTYKTVSNVKYYSDWSAAKYAKTK